MIIRPQLSAAATLVSCCLLLVALPAKAQLETRSGFRTGTTPVSVVVADFNRDGKMDIAVASVTSYEVQVFLGRGDGTFGSPTSYDVGVAADAIAAGDLNHDGNADLVVVNQGSGFASVLLGNGDGTFQSPVNYATPPGPDYVVLGDFNGDGNLDIATTNEYANPCSVSVLIGNGDGTFQEPALNTRLPVAADPFTLVPGYFDGDKNLDLAVAANANNTGEVQILLGNGDGTFRLAPATYWEGLIQSR